MSHFSETATALSNISDAGLFERLATAVLRSAEPSLYSNLTQPGINSKGKTVKAPLDAISFVKGFDEPHMVAVHHTICAQKDLRMKWLRSSVKVPTKESNKKALAPIGDLIKTVEIVAKERRRTDGLLVTLALTTNEEPPEDVTRDAEDIARKNGIQLDIWSRSRIAHYLDNTADGQWLRKKDLGIEQERLSFDLLRLLSNQSLEVHRPPLAQETLIERDFDEKLGKQLPQPIGFIVGNSGYGKTVSSYQFLQAHIKNGGCGLVLNHDLLAISATVDQAIDAALRDLHPSLTEGSGSMARILCSPTMPLVIVVEDVSRSGKSSALIERLIGWSTKNNADQSDTELSWRIICPAWPQHLMGLGDEAKKKVGSLSLNLGPYNKKDAQAALLRRAKLEGINLLPYDADQVIESLGYDPLLIALHSFDNESLPGETIEYFLFSSTERLGSLPGMRSAYEYQRVLATLGAEMVTNKNVNPLWSEVVKWAQKSDNTLVLLNDLARHGEIMRLSRQGKEAQLVFRHDRVRTSVLISGVIELYKNGTLTDDTFSDPFFADIIGSLLTNKSISDEEIHRARALNPLSLFYALKTIREPTNSIQHKLVKSIKQWITGPNSNSRRHVTLRHSALQILAETQSTHVVAIASKFEDRSWNKLLASFINGDYLSGVLLCYSVVPSSNAPWRDNAINYAIEKYGLLLIENLTSLLMDNHISEVHRIGALYLAGHIGTTSLCNPVWLCWKADKQKLENIEAYLWAFSQCSGEESEKFLGPICDAWAELPDQVRNPGSLSKKDGVSLNGLQWAFFKKLPKSSLSYFIWRAQNDRTLSINFVYLLYGVDDPDALEFVSAEMATKAREAEENGWYLHFPRTVSEYWQRQQKKGRYPMSEISRDRLYGIWQNESRDKHTRIQAFKLWSATMHPSDLTILQECEISDLLFDHVLQSRLKRGDKSSIGPLIDKIKNENSQFWWQCKYPVSQTVICWCISFFTSDSFHSKGVKLLSPSCGRRWLYSSIHSAVNCLA